MKVFGVFLALAVASLCLETTLLCRLPGSPWRGPMSFLLILEAASLENRFAGLVFAITLGWLTESFGAPVFGVLPVTYAVVWGGVRWAKERIFLDSPAAWAIWAGFFSILQAMAASLWPGIPLQISILVPCAVYYFALALMLKRPLDRLVLRLKGEREELA